MSPLLSNLYLHEVLEVWFEHEAKPRLRGRAFEVRYADDAVLVFEHEEDARRVRAVLAKRRERYGLACTRTRPGWWTVAARTSTCAGEHSAGQLHDVGVPPLLGTLQEGAWVVKRKTAKACPRLDRGIASAGH